MFALYEQNWKVGAGAWQERCPRADFGEDDIRPAFSNAEATVGLFRDALEAPKGSWQGEWQVEVTPLTDAEGWRYGPSFAAFLSSPGEGMGAPQGACLREHNIFLDRGVRRRRWLRPYALGPPNPTPPRAVPLAAAGGATAPAAAAAASLAAAAAAVPLPLSPQATTPPSRREDASDAFLEALRSSLPLRTDADAALAPATVTADLVALNKMLKVLRNAVGVVHRAALAHTPTPSTLSSDSLLRGAREMTARLQALEGICRARASGSGSAGAGGGGGAGGGAGSTWQRLSTQCAQLARQVGDEVSRLKRPLLPAQAHGSGGASGGARAPSANSAAAAAAAAPLTAAQQVQAQMQAQAQLQLSEADWALQDAEEREREIIQIARDVGEVAQMFKDLSTIVVEQGESIDKLEETTVAAAQHAKKGLENIQEANARQRNSQACAIA